MCLLQFLREKVETFSRVIYIYPKPQYSCYLVPTSFENWVATLGQVLFLIASIPRIICSCHCLIFYGENWVSRNFGILIELHFISSTSKFSTYLQMYILTGSRVVLPSKRTSYRFSYSGISWVTLFTYIFYTCCKNAAYIRWFPVIGIRRRLQASDYFLSSCIWRMGQCKLHILWFSLFFHLSIIFCVNMSNFHS